MSVRYRPGGGVHWSDEPQPSSSTTTNDRPLSSCSACGGLHTPFCPATGKPHPAPRWRRPEEGRAAAAAAAAHTNTTLLLEMSSDGFGIFAPDNPSFQRLALHDEVSDEESTEHGSHHLSGVDDGPQRRNFRRVSHDTAAAKVLSAARSGTLNPAQRALLDAQHEGPWVRRSAPLSRGILSVLFVASVFAVVQLVAVALRSAGITNGVP